MLTASQIRRYNSVFGVDAFSDKKPDFHAPAALPAVSDQTEKMMLRIRYVLSPETGDVRVYQEGAPLREGEKFVD